MGMFQECQICQCKMVLFWNFESFFLFYDVYIAQGSLPSSPVQQGWDVYILPSWGEWTLPWRAYYNWGRPLLFPRFTLQVSYFSPFLIFNIKFPLLLWLWMFWQNFGYGLWRFRCPCLSKVWCGSVDARFRTVWWGICFDTPTFMDARIPKFFFPFRP